MWSKTLKIILIKKLSRILYEIIFIPYGSLWLFSLINIIVLKQSAKDKKPNDFFLEFWDAPFEIVKKC